jgi:uncharacterized phage protein (TIGR02218 family)
MLLLDLLDGTSIGITDHDKDIDYDIGDGTITYLSGTGIRMSDVAMSAGLDADNFEVRGPIGDTVTLAAVLGGVLNRAVARHFQVNWKDLTQGSLNVLKGAVSEARIEGGEFVLEVRSDVDRLNQTVGRTITNSCDADFADGIRCFATATTITLTLTSVTDAMRFSGSYTGSYVDNFFNKGTITGATGENAGATVEIETWTSAGAVVTFAPFAVTPAIGDTFTVKNGCFDPATGQTKSRAACMTFGQILNFRGFPEVPGSDQVLKPAIPGQGSTSGKGK